MTEANMSYIAPFSCFPGGVISLWIAFQLLLTNALNPDETLALSALETAGFLPAGDGVCGSQKVDCSANDEAVIALTLTGWPMPTGSIPTEIGHFYALQTLDITYAKITGTLPAELGNTSLERLNLYNTEITGTFPAQLANVPLRHLDIFMQVDRLSGTLPSLWDSSLTYLRLRKTQLSGSFPAPLTSVALEHLQIEYCSTLSGSLPYSSFINLTYLLLRSTLISGSVPADWSSMTRLQYVYMWYNKETGQLPAVLPATLTYFKAGTSPVLGHWSGTVPNSWFDNTYPNLRAIELGPLGISGAFPPISKPTLEKFYISACSYLNGNLNFLSPPSSLTYFFMSSVGGISGTFPQEIYQSSLRYMYACSLSLSLSQRDCIPSLLLPLGIVVIAPS